MSKYDALWRYVGEREGDALTLTFEEIARIAGTALDHSFLQYKKRTGGVWMAREKDFDEGAECAV